VQTKSVLLFIQIALLTILKEKHEKTVHKKQEEVFQMNLLGRAMFLPLVFFYFTIFKLNKLPGFFFFLHALFLIAYIYFYTEELKGLSGFDMNTSVSS
jgi:hypothetical protein